MGFERNRPLPERDRRCVPRRPVSTPVYVRTMRGKLIRARATDLSASGVFLEGELGGVRVGDVVALHFCVQIGTLLKLHRRTAVVRRSNKRGLGLRM